MKFARILSLALFVTASATAGCAMDDVSSQEQTIHSCFDTGHGLKCVSTPGSVLADSSDVDGDGQVDAFLCGDGASDSDSDADGNVDSDESSEEEATDGTVQILASGPGEEGDEGEDTEDGEDGDDDLDADSDSDSDSDSESDNDCGPSDADSDSDSASDADGDGDGDGISDEIDCDCIDDGGIVVP